ncbi:hypothetical protein Dimus_035694 [Dionaea muscipula]
MARRCPRSAKRARSGDGVMATSLVVGEGFRWRSSATRSAPHPLLLPALVEQQEESGDTHAHITTAREAQAACMGTSTELPVRRASMEPLAKDTAANEGARRRRRRPPPSPGAPPLVCAGSPPRRLPAARRRMVFTFRKPSFAARPYGEEDVARPPMFAASAATAGRPCASLLAKAYARGVTGRRRTGGHRPPANSPPPSRRSLELAEEDDVHDGCHRSSLAARAGTRRSRSRGRGIVRRRPPLGKDALIIVAAARFGRRSSPPIHRSPPLHKAARAAPLVLVVDWGGAGYASSRRRRGSTAHIYIYGARRRPARAEDPLPALLGEDAAARSCRRRRDRRSSSKRAVCRPCTCPFASPHASHALLNMKPRRT